MKKGLIIIVNIIALLAIEVLLMAIYWEKGHKKGIEECEDRVKRRETDSLIELRYESPPVYNFTKYD
jgi:hypothetical protein